MDPDVYEALARLRDAHQQIATDLNEIVQRAIKKLDEPEQHTKKSTSLMSYDVSGINWVEKVGQKGPCLLASKRDNENNPEFENLLKTVKDRWDKKENTWPFWIFTDGNAIGRNKTEKNGTPMRMRSATYSARF